MTETQMMNFVESGRSESLYMTWKESGLTLSAFCHRNAALIRAIWVGGR